MKLVRVQLPSLHERAHRAADYEPKSVQPYFRWRAPYRSEEGLGLSERRTQRFGWQRCRRNPYSDRKGQPLMLANRAAGQSHGTLERWMLGFLEKHLQGKPGFDLHGVQLIDAIDVDKAD